MSKVITDAIVVRVVDYGEADRIATLITRTAGKVSALARSARRSRKRFGGALELFGAGEATLVEGGGDLWRLESLHSQRGFPRLSQDVARLAHAAYVCELSRELSPHHGPEERIYTLLDEMLGLLDRGGEEATLPGAAAALLRAFELALLDAAGLAPSLDRCVGCDGPGGEGDHLDARRGGLVCAACAAGTGSPSLAPSTRRVLQDAQRVALGDARASAAAVAPGDAEAAREVLQSLLREHINKPLRTVEFIEKMNHHGWSTRQS
ncbi:MAG: DNA repair protein RecO [Myxococcales bacterium]|nr:DNA repair protein RecO [Myxococcales bacterium]